MTLLSECASSVVNCQRMPGKLVFASHGRPWRDLLVKIYTLQQIEDGVIIPSVAEPFVVWVLSGDAVIEERELDGAWTANHVRAGDFYLTTSPTPYELRWKAVGSERLEVMHLYLGLPLFRQAAREVLGKAGRRASLREVSGRHDPVLSAFLEQLHREITAPPGRPSMLFVQGIAQSVAVHLVRHYADTKTAGAGGGLRGGRLPASSLRRITDYMEAHLDEEFRLDGLAREAGMSKFHFCRLFNKTTGHSPSRYFIRLRMERARRLLRETRRSVIEIGLDVGYTSPSHFAQVFQRETGMPPSEYRRRE
ncbi:AraC family transcriptional regulator [Termitidicoccus mucosus]|uniref:AraC family transcriptional regulator n=1 Tax=Termitidicoccus mucosus TaxID=1184151 RepID=A0A178IN47_9BACT|nr:AraC family transcriptional regulator [Opitutaceae bacterium TSB47]